MNQDQVSEKLKSLADVPEFKVIFSGKKSKIVDGLYKPATREIIIHNKNMTGETDLIYTAIHEFSHHVVNCLSGGINLTGRCHTAKFWAVFHELLDKAEKKGIYPNPFRKRSDFKSLTEKIKKDFLEKNGTLMKELAALLDKARKLCFSDHLSFDDYLDRELGIAKTTANILLRINEYDLDPSIGYDNMKTVAAVKDIKKRNSAEQAFLEGKSCDTVKNNIIDDKIPKKIPPLAALEAEKKKIEKSIDALRKKLMLVDKMMKEEKNKLTESADHIIMNRGG